MRELHEYHFGFFFVLVVALGLLGLAFFHPELPLSELTGESLHRLGIYTGWAMLMLLFAGGTRWRAFKEMQATPIAFSILLGLLLLGGGFALGH